MEENATAGVKVRWVAGGGVTDAMDLRVLGLMSHFEGYPRLLELRGMHVRCRHSPARPNRTWTKGFEMGLRR
jgi:hypothetical protein